MTVQRLLDPTPVRSLDEHRAVGGMAALEEALRVEPEVSIGVITDAGLRGRGGAGFPTGKKWSTVATNASTPVNSYGIVRWFMEQVTETLLGLHLCLGQVRPSLSCQQQRSWSV